MAENGTVAYVTTLPECDFCRIMAQKANLRGVPEYTIREAEYDFKTRDGRWANACLTHWLLNRAYMTLGTGKGQKLEVSRPTNRMVN